MCIVAHCDLDLRNYPSFKNFILVSFSNDVDIKGFALCAIENYQTRKPVCFSC